MARVCVPCYCQVREAYEKALASAAEGTTPADVNSMPLCHTCRIVKPLRSKHCSVKKRCVPMFDHYCPYVSNTIGGANYGRFITFIFAGLFGVVFTFLAAVQHLALVNRWSVLGWFFAVDFGLVSLGAVLMNQFHASLILRNLTTNEDINKHRYAYLRDDNGKYRNPFSAGACGNIAECCRRGTEVTVNPYVHTERYAQFVASEASKAREMHTLHVDDDAIPSTNDENAQLTAEP